eukprot:6374146-Prymnesium_polylepis.1
MPSITACPSTYLNDIDAPPDLMLLDTLTAEGPIAERLVLHLLALAVPPLIVLLEFENLSMPPPPWETLPNRTRTPRGESIVGWLKRVAPARAPRLNRSSSSEALVAAITGDEDPAQLFAGWPGRLEASVHDERRYSYRWGFAEPAVGCASFYCYNGPLSPAAHAAKPLCERDGQPGRTGDGIRDARCGLYQTRFQLVMKMHGAIREIRALQRRHRLPLVSMLGAYEVEFAATPERGASGPESDE